MNGTIKLPFAPRPSINLYKVFTIPPFPGSDYDRARLSSSRRYPLPYFSRVIVGLSTAVLDPCER